jgi:hypothetical protein
MTLAGFLRSVRLPPLLRRLSLRHALAIAALAATVALAADLSRAPAAQWSTRAALSGIRTYQRHVSSWMPVFGVRCRFTPTCSRYAEVVIARDGVLRGGWMTVRRLVRCGPWTPFGTSDPP